LDEIFGSYTNVVQSPLNVDLANAASSNNAAISAAIDRSDIDNINMSPMDVNGINGVNGVNGIGLGRNGLANSSSATINGHSNLGSELGKKKKKKKKKNY